ncbi:MAG: replication factor C large subunit [Metallosphaera sp.]
MTVPWVVKYRPNSLDEIENQEDVKEELRSWIDSWIKGKPNYKSVLLYGPPGIGKTTMALALAKSYGLEIIEMNASDTRNVTSLRGIAEKASVTGSLFSDRGKLIFLDEIDGIQSKQDFGAISTVLELISNTKYPIMMAANNPWDPNLRELRNATKMIEIKKLGKIPMRRLLKKICANEKVKCEDAAIDVIIEASDGDARYAINMLQSVAEGYGQVTQSVVEELVRRKERELDPFETLRSLFWAQYGWQAKQAVSRSQTDYELLIRWISENVPIQYEMLNDIWRAYDALSRASIFLSRSKMSSWDLLSYTFDMMGPGVALAEVGKKSPNWKAKWKKYQFPTYVQQLYRSKSLRNTRDSIISKIGRNIHASARKVYNDVYPFFLQYAKEIESSKSLDLSPKEIEFLRASTKKPTADTEARENKPDKNVTRRTSRRSRPT